MSPARRLGLVGAVTILAVMIGRHWNGRVLTAINQWLAEDTARQQLAAVCSSRRQYHQAMAAARELADVTGITHLSAIRKLTEQLAAGETVSYPGDPQ